MGAPPKGLVHGRRSMVGYMSMAGPLVTSMIKTGGEQMVVHVAAASMPPYAPLIYAGYTAFRVGRFAFQSYREYTELRDKMSEERALRVEGERIVSREGLESGSSANLEEFVNRKVSVLLARPEIESTIEKALDGRVTEETKERLRMMLQETTTRFLVGAAQGGKGKLVDEATKLFFR